CNSPPGDNSWVSSIGTNGFCITVEIICKTTLTFINNRKKAQLLSYASLCIDQTCVVISIYIGIKILSSLQINTWVERDPIIFSFYGDEMLVPKFSSKPRSFVF